jgi:hypothetical protein
VSEVVGLDTELDLDRYVAYYGNKANDGMLAVHERRDKCQPRTDDSQDGCLARRKASPVKRDDSLPRSSESLSGE